jgi:1,2-diacylglycerol 3-alpha-glucosyltransferase
MRVGILTEFPSPAVQSGPAIHTRFLKDGLTKRGHGCTLIGPDTSDSAPTETGDYYLFKAWPYPTHRDVKLAMPGRPIEMFRNPPKVDVIHSQASSHMLHYGAWMRKMWQIPLLHTHVVHMPTHCHFLLSDGLYQKEWVLDWWRKRAEAMERSFAGMYNQGDCLIVQSHHFVDYWRERGVTVPIEVVGRPINPDIFSAQSTHDPYPKSATVGKRMVVVCRHDREKNLNYLLDLFAQKIAPVDSEVTLTLVGDGHDHRNLVEHAAALPHSDRVHFVGEVAHDELVNWYTHGDLFVYTSLSETFGNVVNEALWSGLPVVALNDHMGVAGQLIDGKNGFLIDPDTPQTDHQFAAACITLLHRRPLRRSFGEEAATISRRTSHPDVVLSRFEKIYGEAKQHCLREVPTPLSEKNKVAQVSAYLQAVGQWAFWTSVLFGVAHAATTMGATRVTEAKQHVEPPSEPAASPRESLETASSDAA